MAAALRKAVENRAFSKIVASSHGTKYIVDSWIESPSGKTPLVRTIWIVDLGLEKSAALGDGLSARRIKEEYD